MPSKASEILANIDWFKWLEVPGYPPIKNDYSNKYIEEIKAIVDLFYENKLPDNFTETFKEWHTILKTYFLTSIRDTNRELDDIQLSYLSNTMNLKEGYNVEINCLYFLIVLIRGKTIEENVKNALVSFLGKHGRINYIRPIYTELIKRDKQLAVSTFEKYRNFYHPDMVKLIERLIKTIN